MNRLIWPLFVPAALCALGAVFKVEPKFSVSESVRHESLTVRDFNRSETRSVTVGKMTFHAEVPMQIDANLDPATPVTIKVGDFNFTGTLKEDVKYQPGRNQARLSQREDTPGSTIRSINGTVNLKWTKDKLTVDVESKSGLAAGKYVENVAGEQKGEVAALIEIGGQKVEANVPFAAKIRRKTAGDESQFGQVVTIDLKGKL
jgi:hypothetical protein